jgi:hypothetical protein
MSTEVDKHLLLALADHPDVRGAGLDRERLVTALAEEELPASPQSVSSRRSSILAADHGRVPRALQSPYHSDRKGVRRRTAKYAVRVRSAFRWLTAILFVAVVAEVALAAFGGFDAEHKAEHASISKKMIEDSFNGHGILGTLIVVLMLILLIITAAGRIGPVQTRFVGLILGLGILQFVLGLVSTSAPVLGLLHGLNALAIFAATGMLAHRTWTRDGRVAASARRARAPMA